MLSWMILIIGNHPDVQQAIYEEQTRLFGDLKTSPEQSDLHKMKYLECVIKECVCFHSFLLHCFFYSIHILL